MIPQYVAAALVSENKVLCHPASVDSIPTSAGQEDHVSMGNAAGLKAWQVLANAERALAIELLAGAQAVEFLAPLEPGVGVRATHDARALALAAAARRPSARRRHRAGRRVDPRRLARRGRRGRDRRAAVRVRRWEMPDEPLPQHPYRDSAIFHFVLASLIVLVAWVTGGGLGRAFGFAAAFFVLATGWSWWRWRERLAEHRAGGAARRHAARAAPKSMSVASALDPRSRRSAATSPRSARRAEPR